MLKRVDGIYEHLGETRGIVGPRIVRHCVVQFKQTLLRCLGYKWPSFPIEIELFAILQASCRQRMVLVPQIESFVILVDSILPVSSVWFVFSDLNETVCGEQIARLLILDAGLI